MLGQLIAKPRFGSPGCLTLAVVWSRDGHFESCLFCLKWCSAVYFKGWEWHG